MKSNVEANPLIPASLYRRDAEEGRVLRSDALRLAGPQTLTGRALSLYPVKDDRGRYYVELRDQGGDVRRFAVKSNETTNYLSTDGWIDVTGSFAILDRPRRVRTVFVDGETSGGGSYAKKPRAGLFDVHGDVSIKTWNT